MDEKNERLKPKLVLNVKAVSERNCILNGEPINYVGISKKYGVSGQTAYLWQTKMPRIISIIKQIMDDYGMTFEELIKEFEPKKRPMKKLSNK